MLTNGVLYSTWKHIGLKDLVNDADGNTYRLLLEEVDPASRIWLHYMFLRRYQETTTGELVKDPFTQHHHNYFVYGMLLSEPADNKPSHTDDPLVIHLAHTLYCRMGARSPVHEAFSTWRQHAVTTTKVATEDPEGIVEAAYYLDLLNKLRALNKHERFGQPTEIIQIDHEVNMDEKHKDTPRPTLSQDCTCDSCKVKSNLSFAHLRAIFNNIKDLKHRTLPDLVTTSNSAIRAGIAKYGIFAISFLQQISLHHSLNTSVFDANFMEVLNFMSGWITCQSLSEGEQKDAETHEDPNVPAFDNEYDTSSDEDVSQYPIPTSTGTKAESSTTTDSSTPSKNPSVGSVSEGSSTVVEPSFPSKEPTAETTVVESSAAVGSSSTSKEPTVGSSSTPKEPTVETTVVESSAIVGSSSSSKKPTIETAVAESSVDTVIDSSVSEPTIQP